MRRRSDSLKANLCQAQQRDLKTITPLSHRPIVLTDTIDYRTIGFLHYRPNPTYNSDRYAVILLLRVLSTGMQFVKLDCSPASDSSHYVGCKRAVAVGSLVVRALDSRLDRFPDAAASTGVGDRLRAGKPPQYVTKPPRPTQPPTFRETSEYQPKCGDVLLLGSNLKARMAYPTCR